MFRLYFLALLFLSKIELNAQFDFQPYKNIYDKYLSNTKEDSSYYLLWYYHNENNSYISDTTFYVIGFDNMQLSYLIDYSSLSMNDTVDILLNDTIVASYQKQDKVFLFNDLDYYTGKNVSYKDALGKFKEDNPYDTVKKIDSIKHYSKIDNELKYYKKNTFKYDKLNLRFKTSNKNIKSGIKFILYGQFNQYIQQIIYLPNKDEEKSILKLSYNNLNKSSPSMKNGNLCYHITDLGFPISHNEFNFYKNLPKILNKFIVKYNSK